VAEVWGQFEKPEKVETARHLRQLTRGHWCWPGGSLCSVFRLLVSADGVSSTPILVTLTMEALSSSKLQYLLEPHGVTFQKMAFF
jgi:hypothetical protein